MKNHILELEKELAAEKVAKRELASFKLNEVESITLQVKARQRLSADEARRTGTAAKNSSLISIKTTWGELAERISSALIVKNTARVIASVLSRAYTDDILDIIKTQQHFANDEADAVSWQVDEQSLARVRAMLVAAGFIVVDVENVTTSSPFRSLSKYDTGVNLSTKPIEYWVPTAEGIKYFGPKAVSRFASLEDDLLNEAPEI